VLSDFNKCIRRTRI